MRCVPQNFAESTRNILLNKIFLIDLLICFERFASIWFEGILFVDLQSLTFITFFLIHLGVDQRTLRYNLLLYTFLTIQLLSTVALSSKSLF